MTPPPKYQTGNEVMHCPDHTELVGGIGELKGMMMASVRAGEQMAQNIERLFEKVDTLASAVSGVKQTQSFWSGRLIGAAAVLAVVMDVLLRVFL